MVETPRFELELGQKYEKCHAEAERGDVYGKCQSAAREPARVSEFSLVQEAKL